MKDLLGYFVVACLFATFAFTVHSIKSCEIDRAVACGWRCATRTAITNKPYEARYSGGCFCEPLDVPPVTPER